MTALPILANVQDQVILALLKGLSLLPDGVEFPASPQTPTFQFMNSVYPWAPCPPFAQPSNQLCPSPAPCHFIPRMSLDPQCTSVCSSCSSRGSPPSLYHPALMLQGWGKKREENDSLLTEGEGEGGSGSVLSCWPLSAPSSLL